MFLYTREAHPGEHYPHVETLEQMLAGHDLMSLLANLLESWSGDDIDELFELLETQLGDEGVDLKYYSHEDDAEHDEYDDDDL